MHHHQELQFIPHKRSTYQGIRRLIKSNYPEPQVNMNQKMLIMRRDLSSSITTILKSSKVQDKLPGMGSVFQSDKLGDSEPVTRVSCR